MHASDALSIHVHSVESHNSLLSGNRQQSLCKPKPVEHMDIHLCPSTYRHAKYLLTVAYICLMAAIFLLLYFSRSGSHFSFSFIHLSYLSG